MADNDGIISKSRRRFIESVLVLATALGVGFAGYEVGLYEASKVLVKTAQCPPCTQYGLPQGYDYVIYASDGNYYVVNSKNQVMYKSSDPGDAIEYAISQLGGKGGRVLIRSGLYVCTKYPCISINNSNSSGTLIIDSEYGAVITVANNAVNGVGALLSLTGSNVVISNITIDGNSQHNNYVVDNQFNILVSNARNVWLVNVKSINGPNGFALVNSSNVAMMGVKGSGNRFRGVYVSGSNTVLLLSSYIERNGYYGIEIDGSTNAVVVNTVLLDNGNGVLINNSDALLEVLIEFVKAKGNYGINASVTNPGYELIISNSVVRGNVANAISLAVSNAMVGISNSIVHGGSETTLNVSGSNSTLVIEGSRFTDLSTAPGSYPYIIKGLNSTLLSGNEFVFGNQVSQLNGLKISDVDLVVVRGNVIRGYTVGLDLSNCGTAHICDNYFMDVTTPVTYTNTGLVRARANVGWTPIVNTPSVPASGLPVVNNYPVSVMVYVYGGSVTQITIVKANRSYTAYESQAPQPLNSEYFILDPGDSITITYVQPPSWVWVPVNY
jgi:hypothetical protein